MLTTSTAIATETIFRSVWERLIAARDILLVSPKRPDGDSIGSICGLRAALATQGKSATLYCPDPVPPMFHRIPYVHEVRGGIKGQQFDAIVICDAGDLAYAGVSDDLPQWQRSGGALIVIDHHATNVGYGDVRCIVPTAASTTQVIAAMLAANRVRLTPDTATALLFGLVTDTDGFTNPVTSAAALATAGRLTAAGARIAPILRAVYQAKPIAALRLWGQAFERLTVNRWGIATTVLLPEDFRECRNAADRSSDAAPDSTGASEVETGDGLSNFLQNVIPARAILVLKDEGEGVVRGSFRTQRDDVDVGRLAALFGGGGHRKASGFGIPGRIVWDGGQWRVV